MKDDLRHRIVEFGEVFTSEREVNAMLDLVSDEAERIDSRFLEPACGDGNFLSEVLRRKLNVVKKNYGRQQHDYEKYAFLAASSVYGIDILADNVARCRERLCSTVDSEYCKLFPAGRNGRFSKSIQFLLNQNIIWGDALTLLKPDRSEPITFAEWSFVSGSFVKRKDYTLHTLLAYQPMGEETLFSDMGDQAFIPKPIREYPQTHFLEVSDV